MCSGKSRLMIGRYGTFCSTRFAMVINRLFAAIEELDDERLRAALADVRAMAETLLGWQKASAQESEEIYKVGQNTTRFLMSVGDLVIGWLLLRSARISDSKRPAAEFFAQTVLPELTSRRRVLEATSNALMEHEL